MIPPPEYILAVMAVGLGLVAMGICLIDMLEDRAITKLRKEGECHDPRT